MGLLAVLPFLGKFSLNLRKSLYKLVSKSLTQCNIKVIFQSKNRLNSLLKLKDSIPLFFHCHLVYKFQCSNCDNTYHGEIERHLKVRAVENISTSPLTEKRSINNKKFPVKDHCFCQVACVHLMILPSWIVSHTSLNVWSKNLYLSPRINHYWINKLNHWN